ncbi:MAG: ATP-binding protein [Salibacteraceae bacterium]
MANATFFHWSSGKDAAFGLYELLQNPEYEVRHLLTTINRDLNRVSMHGLRTEMLQLQMDAIGLPNSTVALSQQATMDEYNAAMSLAYKALKEQLLTHGAFGDIFLEDLRQYREKEMARQQITPLFPLWKRNTTALVKQFIEQGFRAVVVCVNLNLLDCSFLGRELDLSFLEALPSNVDPCGENGEFHTYCFQAPFFKQSIPFVKGKTVIQEYPSPIPGEPAVPFGFIDLLPAPGIRRM